MNINTLFNGLIWTFIVVVGLAFVKWIKGLINAKRQAKILEIDLALRKISSDNSKLSLDDLIIRANERDKPRDPSDTP